MDDAIEEGANRPLPRVMWIAMAVCFLLAMTCSAANARADEVSLNEHPMQEGVSSLMEADASFYLGNYTGNPTSSTGGYSPDYKGPILWDVLDTTGASSATCMTDRPITTAQWQDAYGNWGLHGSWYNNSLVKPICDDFASTKNFSTLEYELLQTSHITWDEPQWIKNEDQTYEVFQMDTGSGDAIAYPLTNDEVLSYKNKNVSCISDYSYWTRTPEIESGNPWSEYTYSTSRNWTLKTGLLATTGVRPAANIDLSDVLLVSAAYSGKASGEASTSSYVSEDSPETLTKVNASAEPSKLTLHDSSRDGFEAGFWKSVSSFDGSESYDSSSPISTADEFAIHYSGATVGENNYVSAILKDSDGNIVYYERLVDCAKANGTGTVWMKMPADIAGGTYTLGLYSENYNGTVSAGTANIVGGCDQYSTASPTDTASDISYVTLTVVNGVSFNPNGADQPTSSEVVSGSNGDKILTKPSTWGTRYGYDLTGWNTSSDITSSTNVHYGCAPEGATVDDLGANYVYTINNVVTLYAEWTPKEYQVTFDANGGTGTMSAQTMTYDEETKLSCNRYTNGTSGNYRFSGWNTSADGSGTSYSDGQSVKNLVDANGNGITLYAQWEDEESNVVSYDLYFGSLYKESLDKARPYGNDSPTAYTWDWVSFTAKEVDFSYRNDEAVDYGLGREWINSTEDPQGASVAWLAGNGGGTHFMGWYYDNDTTDYKTGDLITTDMTCVPDTKGENGENRDITSCVGYIEANTCTINFDSGADGDTELTGTMDPMSVVYYDRSKAPECGYTRSGWVFKGWSASDGARQKTYQPGDRIDQIDTSNVDGATYTLTAMWEKSGGYLYYMLNADDATGSIPTEWHQGHSTFVLASGNSIHRTGYILDSWKQGTVEGTWEGAWSWEPYATYKMPAVGDAYVYAGWVERSGFKLVVDANGGTYSDGSTQRSRDDISWNTNALTEGEQPSRPGYQFVQYNMLGEGSAEPSEVEYDTRWCDVVRQNESVDVATIYAVWTPNNYHIVFDKNADDASGSTNTQYFYYGTSQSLNASGYTRLGYTFLGWSTDPNATAAEYADGATVNNLTTEQYGEVNLYAVWSKDPNAAIAYKAVGDGVAKPASESLDPVSDTASGSTATANGGNHFVEWTDESDSSMVTTDAHFTPAKVGGVNVSGTYDANFQVNTCHIVFDSGSSEATGTMDSIDVTYGTEQSLPTCAFVRPGYSFTGWAASVGAASSSYSDGADVSGIDTSTVDGTTYTLTATWESNSRVLSFDSNGGTGTVDSQNHDKGTQVTLPDGTGLSRDGYIFMGWSETANGALAYSSGDSYTMPAVDTTLYACWKPCEYTVSFDGNADDVKGSMADQTIVYGVEDALSSNTYTRDGYTFIGWATDASSTEVAYTDGQTVENLSAEDGGKVTLHAVWSKDSNGGGDDGGDGSNGDGSNSDGSNGDGSATVVPVSDASVEAIAATGDSTLRSVGLLAGLAGLVGLSLIVVSGVSRLSKRSSDAGSDEGKTR